MPPMSVGSPGLGSPAAAGPVQRALRDTERQISTMRHEIKRVESDLRKVFDGLLETIREGTDHREATAHRLAAMEDAKDGRDATISELREALHAHRHRQAQHAQQLASQQAQIEGLHAAMARQREVMDEYVVGATEQAQALNGELAELKKGFSAQRAAGEAVKSFVR